MSWNSYTDNLINSGFKKAGIYGFNGGKWAASGSIQVTDKEAVNLYKGFGDSNMALKTTPPTIEGKKYMCVQVSDNYIYGKEVKPKEESEKVPPFGLTVYKTGKCIIVALYDKGLQAGAANNAVDKVAQFLIDNGY
jgi:profilin